MKQLYEISLPDVVAVMGKKGYTIFTNGRPNIVGIRNDNKDAGDAFNDTCWVWWYDGQNKVVHNYTITTDPGVHYRENPIAGSAGTAILVAGQYIDCWVLGMHRGKQFALCQRAGEVSVYRDNNKDAVLNLDPTTIQKGWWGIDLHNAGLADPEQIGPWSAGCQVWRYHQPHEDLMNDFKILSGRYSFTQFSYSLLEQGDFS